jgi:hypothetical protein
VGSAPLAAPPGTKVAVERYFPLSAGSRWTYRVQDLRKGWTYRNNVKVYGPVRFDGLEGIEVEERYTGGSSPWILEEQEPIVYYRADGFLHRVFLTRQAGKLVAASGSSDTRFLPEWLEPGATWTSETRAFRLQPGELGFGVAHEHTIRLESEPVRVPAGTFRGCLRIDTHSSHGPNSGARPGEEIVFYYSDWYAPGVGLVRTQQWDDPEHRSERSRIELLEFAIPSGPGDPEGR